MKKKEMIKRADGSYSQKGLWDNIRANKGSGNKVTKQLKDAEERLREKEREKGRKKK